MVVGPGYGGAPEITDLAGEYRIRVQYRHPCGLDFVVGDRVPISATVALFNAGEDIPYNTFGFEGELVVDNQINEAARSSAILGTFTIPDVPTPPPSPVPTTAPTASTPVPTTEPEPDTEEESILPSKMSFQDFR